MASKFMDAVPSAEAEAQMQQVPGFRPRKSGISVSRLACIGRQTKECAGKNKPPNASCGGAQGEAKESFFDLLGHFTEEVAFAPFSERVAQIEGSQTDAYRDAGHEERFRIRWQAREKVPDESAMCAALYLLTADRRLWEMAEASVKPGLIDFAQIHIRGTGLDGYVLFHSAKDLYKGTNRLTLSELTDPELISDMTFWTVINAFLIRRYGEGMLSGERRREC